MERGGDAIAEAVLDGCPAQRRAAASITPTWMLRSARRCASGGGRAMRESWRVACGSGSSGERRRSEGHQLITWDRSHSPEMTEGGRCPAKQGVRGADADHSPGAQPHHPEASSMMRKLSKRDRRPCRLVQCTLGPGRQPPPARAACCSGVDQCGAPMYTPWLRCPDLQPPCCPYARQQLQGQMYMRGLASSCE